MQLPSLRAGESGAIWLAVTAASGLVFAVFLYRFFKISQFKRSAIPNGPKVGSGGSLSPRGDWRAPSDSEPEVWLKELRENVPG